MFKFNKQITGISIRVFVQKSSTMARTEKEKKVKRQGKKRKHEAAVDAAHAGSDDEVAIKSLILEPQGEQQATPKGEYKFPIRLEIYIIYILLRCANQKASAGGRHSD